MEGQPERKQTTNFEDIFTHLNFMIHIVSGLNIGLIIISQLIYLLSISVVTLT